MVRENRWEIVVKVWFVSLDVQGKFHCSELYSYREGQNWAEQELRGDNTIETCVVEAPSRHHALKIARKDWVGRALGREKLHCQLCGKEADRLFGTGYGRRKIWVCKECLEK